MPFKRIPESSIASSLSNLVTKQVANLLNTAKKKALELVQKKIAELSQKIRDIVLGKLAKVDLCAELNRCLDAINGVKTGTGNIKSLLTILKTTAATLKVPVAALKIAIKVIKALPIPQAPLVVSFTVLESDMLEMLEELVTQADRLVQALDNTYSALSGKTDSVLDLTNLADGLVTAVSVVGTLNGVGCNPAEVTDADREKMTEAGLLDPETGESIFEKIIDAATEGNDFILQGDLSKGSVTDPEYSLRDSGRESGDSTGSSGSSSKDTSSSGGESGNGSNGSSGSGSGTNGSDPGNDSSGSGGDLGDVSNLDIDLGYVSDTALDNIVSLGDIGDTFEWQGREVTILDPKNNGSSPGIIKIPLDISTGKPDYLGYLQEKLQDLSDLDLSESLREAFQDISFNREEKSRKDGSIEGLEKGYLSKTGRVYTMKIIRDTTYINLASRHFVRAFDSRGVFVLEGPRSFTLEPDVLFQDMEVRLDLITL